MRTYRFIPFETIPGMLKTRGHLSCLQSIVIPVALSPGKSIPNDGEIDLKLLTKVLAQEQEVWEEWPRPEGLVIGKLQWSGLCSSAIRQCVPSQCLSAGVKGHHLNGQSSAPTPQTLSSDWLSSPLPSGKRIFIYLRELPGRFIFLLVM
ncbi:unnamed protein product [Arctogadus glacialis]